MQPNTTLAQPKKLLAQVRDKIRFKHYSLSTENTYLSWIKQFILYHGKRHPAIMIFELVAYFDGFETFPRQASKYGLSGTSANRYGSYRS